MLQKKNRNDSENNEVKVFCLINRVLNKTVKRNNKEVKLFVIPKEMRKLIVMQNHDLRHHFGVHKTYDLISRHYYFVV